MLEFVDEVETLIGDETRLTFGIFSGKISFCPSSSLSSSPDSYKMLSRDSLEVNF